MNTTTNAFYYTELTLFSILCGIRVLNIQTQVDPISNTTMLKVYLLYPLASFQVPENQYAMNYLHKQYKELYKKAFPALTHCTMFFLTVDNNLVWTEKHYEAALEELRKRAGIKVYNEKGNDNNDGNNNV